MANKRIIVVDDEKMILGVVERVLQTSLDCEVFTALSAHEALEIMKGKSFDVVISDMGMPGIDGARFLEIIKELYPQTVRMVFSARAGHEFGLRVMDVAHQYFLKPTSVKTIGEKITKILAMQRFLPANCSIEEIASRIKTLPSIPKVYKELEKELDDSYASIEHIGRVIETDVSMSAKVLQLVNSAFFGLRERVAKPAQAAALLGTKVLRSLVLAMHTFSESRKHDVLGFSLQELWDHSLGSAILCRRIALAEKMDTVMVEDMYVSGLFHDVGKLIIFNNLPESLAHINAVCRIEDVSQLDVETRIIGVTHSEIGAYLLAMWGFPQHVVDICANHHFPERVEPDVGSLPRQLAVAHVADQLDHEQRLTASSSRGGINADYLTQCGLADRLPVWRTTLLAK